jgi:hypothetical protein
MLTRVDERGVDEDERVFETFLVSISYFVELLLIDVPFWKAIVVSTATAVLVFNGIARGTIKVAAAIGAGCFVAEWLGILPQILRR